MIEDLALLYTHVHVVLSGSEDYKKKTNKILDVARRRNFCRMDFSSHCRSLLASAHATPLSERKIIMTL